VQTVYFHFGNKRTVLKEVMDVLAVGDDAPVPLLERRWVQQVRDEPDPRRALGIWLRNSRVIYGRVAPMLSIVRDAAGADPEMAEQWQTNQHQRYLAHRTLTEILAAKKALRPGLTVQNAADIIFTLLSPEVYLLLTAERGWSPHNGSAGSPAPSPRQSCDDGSRRKGTEHAYCGDAARARKSVQLARRRRCCLRREPVTEPGAGS
jgi:AcrR family transcriptional regulator